MIRALLATAVVLLVAAPPARADDVADARARFRKGADRYRAKQYRDAISEFEAAYRLKPHGAIHFNVAQCRERLEEWPGALRSYTDYLREVPDARDRAAVRAAMARLEARIAAAGVQALLVYSDPPGAEVRIDGRARGRTPFHTVLSPGRYRVALVLEAHAGAEEDVEVAASASRVMEVELRPERVVATSISTSTPTSTSTSTQAQARTETRTQTAARERAAPDLSPRPPSPLTPPPPERPQAKRRVYTWVAAGTAAAAVAAGAYFGAAAKQKSDQLRDGTARTAADGLAADARSKARTANVLYGLAGAAGVAGVTLFFVEGRF
jgi:hypothetical protein